MNKKDIICLGIIFVVVILFIYSGIVGHQGIKQGKAICSNKGMEYVEKISTGFYTDDYICRLILEDGEIKYYYVEG